jgi:plastocyanin
MAFPKVLFAIPLLLAGAFLPFAGAAPPTPPTGVVGMDHEVFTINEITIDRGATLTFANNSRFLHILGPGRDGSLGEVDGLPMHERALTEIDDKYTTGRWNALGTFYITCSMHPDMTVKVIVKDCGCCSHGSCG